MVAFTAVNALFLLASIAAATRTSLRRPLSGEFAHFGVRLMFQWIGAESSRAGEVRWRPSPVDGGAAPGSRCRAGCVRV